MKTYHPVRIHGILAMLLTTILFFISCNKADFDVADKNYFTQPQDLGAKTSSTASGFVTSETDQPVAGATVQLGTATTITDQYGYFEINNAVVTQNAAVVTVTEPGYFKGIKTYIAAAGGSAFFRIKLIPKISAGTFNGASGGTVTVNNALHISFVPGGIVNAATGEAYSGTVNVAAFWINPVAADLNKIIPGDQRGIAADGTMKGLTTYGMAAVELSGSSGELLQVAPGKKATLNMEIPAAILPFAPASIPLWYFDEKSGLWTEQGSAAKTGNSYSGDVSHFSFWNCDIPETFVHFDCTIADAAGNPVKNALVKISVANNPNAAAWGYTNEAGYVAGPILANKDLLLEVGGDAACGTPVYTQHFTTTTANISLGRLTVNAVAGIASVSGSVSDCSNKVVSNGCVILEKYGQYYRYPVNKDGSYAFSTLLCNSSAVVNLLAYDASVGQYSQPVNISLTTGTNTRANIQACGSTSDQFINYTVNGVSYNFTYPAATFEPVIPGNDLSFATSNMNGDEAGFRFPGTGISNNSSEPLTYFMASQVHDLLTPASPIQVNITEYATADQAIAGNFTGTFRGAAPGSKLYTISCRFRVKALF